MDTRLERLIRGISPGSPLDPACCVVVFRSMGQAVLEPLTAFIRLDESATLHKYRELDRFSVVGVETTGRLAEAVQKTSEVRALLVSISLRPVPAREYRLRVDGKVVSTGNIPAFRANVIDFAAEPTIWGERGIYYTHFHLRRAVIDELAADLGYARIGEFRGAVAEDDAVLAQMARGATSRPPIDHSSRLFLSFGPPLPFPASRSVPSTSGQRCSKSLLC